MIATAITFVAGLLLLGSTAFAADPPGNNGTVKVDANDPFDSDPNNEPHVTCPFQIDFYGFDEGDLHATITLLAWDPTQPERVHRVAPDQTVFIGEDAAGGGTDLDASQTYDETLLDFSGIEPQQNQGFHVKAIIHAEGSKGADTKHKVFWVQPCEEEEESSTTTSTTSTTLPGESSSSTSTTRGGGALPTVASSISGGRRPLPFTGSNALPLLIAGLGLLALGGASVVASRRQRHQNGG